MRPDDQVDAPESTERTEESSGGSQREIVAVQTVDDMLYRRQTKMIRLKLWVQQRLRALGSAASAARTRQGTTARMATLALLNAGVVAALAVLGASGGIVAVSLLVLVVVDALLVAHTLRTAHQPSPTPPEDALIPNSGIPRLRYAAHRAFGRADIVPAINSKQRAEEDVRLSEEVDDLRSKQDRLVDDRLRYIYNLNIHLVVGIFNQKGASSKSTFAVNSGNMLRKALGCIVTLITASTSTQSATAAKIAGVWRRTITTRGLHRVIVEKGDNPLLYREARKYIGLTMHGLGVVAEDSKFDDISTSGKSNFATAQWRRVATVVINNSDLVVMDSGNEDALPDTITVAGMRMCDVVIIPANTRESDTPEAAGRTYGNYLAVAEHSANNPIPVKPPQLRESGEDIPLDEKLRAALVVFNAADSSVDPHEYVEAFKVGLSDTDTDLSEMAGLYFGGIQLDPYLVSTNRGIDFQEMESETIRHYKAVLLEAFERAAMLRGVALPERDPLIRDIGLRIG